MNIYFFNYCFSMVRCFNFTPNNINFTQNCTRRITFCYNMTTAAATVAPIASKVLKGMLVVASETLLVEQKNVSTSDPYASFVPYGTSPVVSNTTSDPRRKNLNSRDDKVFPSPQDITLSRVSNRTFKSTSVEFIAANADSRILKRGRKEK